MSPVQTGSPKLRGLAPYRWVGVALIVVVLGALGAVILLGRPTGIVQKRTDFATAVLTLRSDLAWCDTRVSAAVVSWRQATRGSHSSVRAGQEARAASRACVPGTDNAIFELTLYAVPSSLTGLRLSYAVSCLGVWAQEDAAPAMRNELTLLSHPGDRSAAAAYRRQAGWAAANLAAANSTLERAARKLGISNFSPLQLTPLITAGLPLLPS